MALLYRRPPAGAGTGGKHGAGYEPGRPGGRRGGDGGGAAALAADHGGAAESVLDAAMAGKDAMVERT
jgi:hypothetical protein